MAQTTSIFDGGNPIAFNPKDDLLLLIVQILVIIVFTRLLQWPLGYLKQPRVIAEVIGGILLGPTALGRIPAFKNNVFPTDSLPYLGVMAELGLIFFLFLIGLELDPKTLVRDARTSMSVSLVGIVVCFIFSLGAAFPLYDILEQTKREVSFGIFYLFMGVAMSITAFPVLARILSELKLFRTPVGMLAISAAAVDDAAAWILLALVVSLINANSGLTSLWIFLVCLAYCAFVATVVRRFILFLLKREQNMAEDGPSQLIVVVTVVLVLSSAWFTAALGIHAIFGGFIIGVVIPHDGGFAVKLAEKFEDFVSVIFLPLYFALSGLKTQIGLIDTATAWGLVVLCIVIAVSGKIIGTIFAARLGGVSWRESFTVGVLMACKGLVELIVLNIGLDAGVLDERIFAILVFMAVFVTLITTPVVSLIYPAKYQRHVAVMRSQHVSKSHLPSARASFADLGTVSMTGAGADQHRVLLVVDKLDQLPTSMHLLNLFTPTQKENASIHAVRLMKATSRMSSLIRCSDTAFRNSSDAVANVLRTFARMHHFDVNCTVTVCGQNEFDDAVVDHAIEDMPELVLLPWHARNQLDQIEQDGKSEFNIAELVGKNSAFGHYARNIFRKVTATTAVMIDQGFGDPKFQAMCVRVDGDLVQGTRDASDASDLPTATVLFTGGEDARAALQLGRLAAANRMRVRVVRVRCPAGASDSFALEQTVDDDAVRASKLAVDSTVATEGELVTVAQQLPSSDLVIVGRGAAGPHSTFGTLGDTLLSTGCSASVVVVRAAMARPLTSGPVTESKSEAN